jgi:hypothetical protein
VTLFLYAPDMPEKRCTGCGTVKSLVEFAVATGKKSGHLSRCKSCDAEKARLYYAANKAKKQAYDLGRAKEVAANRFALRKAAERVYGGECAVCGTSEGLEFDHVNGDGREHRLSEDHNTMVRRIASLGEKLPDVELQLLCFDHHHEKSLTDGDYGKRYAS